MRQLGIFILVSGFCGIPAFLLTGLTRNSLLGVVLHVVLAVAYAVYLIMLGERGRTDTASGHSIHPFLTMLAGVAFLSAGIYLALHGNPSDGPDAMNRNEIIHFGTIFILVGGGTALFSLRDCFSSNKGPVNRLRIITCP